MILDFCLLLTQHDKQLVKTVEKLCEKRQTSYWLSMHSENLLNILL